jgi:6-phosphogluconate dehydrogenase
LHVVLSAQKDLRVQASKVLNGPKPVFKGDKKQFIDDIESALLGAKIISYAQGYNLMMEAAKEYGWNLNYGGIALMWRGGCIIRSVFLADIKKAFDNNPELANLLLDPFFKDLVESSSGRLEKSVCNCARKRRSGSGAHIGTLLFRWFPHRKSAGQPVAGTARLFWRPHLRTYRQTPW